MEQRRALIVPIYFAEYCFETDMTVEGVIEGMLEPDVYQVFASKESIGNEAEYYGTITITIGFFTDLARTRHLRGFPDARVKARYQGKVRATSGKVQRIAGLKRD